MSRREQRYSSVQRFGFFIIYFLAYKTSFIFSNVFEMHTKTTARDPIKKSIRVDFVRRKMIIADKESGPAQKARTPTRRGEKAARLQT